MWLEHQDHVSQCGLCGISFALPQELSSHLKSKCHDQKDGRKLENTEVKDP
jgi:hypothetical protein